MKGLCIVSFLPYHKGLWHLLKCAGESDKPLPSFLIHRKDFGIYLHSLEGHLQPDHVHILIAIPPKHAVSQVMGYLKGKSAIYLARNYGENRRNATGQHFWARGFFVSTVGRDEDAVREYIRQQEEEDKRLDQLNLWD